MARINMRRRQNDKLEPWQLFDLIAGTSTGGYVDVSQIYTTATIVDQYVHRLIHT